MSDDDRERLSGQQNEERGPLIARVISLVPLLKLVLEFLELILKIFKVIN